MKTINLIFVLLFIIFGCKTTINPSKQEFYCKINGVVFIPEKDTSPFGGVGSNPLKIQWDRTYNWLYISALNTPNYISIFIKLLPNESISIGEYNLYSDIKGNKAYYTYNSSASQSEDLISSSGKIIITKIEGTTIWGTFEFKTKSVKINTEYTISEGQINALRY